MSVGIEGLHGWSLTELQNASRLFAGEVYKKWFKKELKLKPIKNLGYEY